MSSIISYAQNFEDVMLWRALGHIKNGFYIDIGAQDPLIDSVSLAFHEHGWKGIHIEPTPHYAEMLRLQRPGDKIIQAAISTEEGIINFFEIPETGISTADAVIAQQHRERGFETHEIAVVSITLAAVFTSCTEPEIHWLKIDVEGFEQQVLTSWSPSPARPWIVVVESTLPSTQIETHETWESILITYGYTPVYFDGLNRYYISNAHPELQQAFRAPPNIFDGFRLNGTASFPIYHLIAARHKQQISEIVAQNEEQGLFVKKEMDRLNQSLVELSQTYTEQQHASDLHEAKITAQLHAIQQQAVVEKNEISQQYQTKLQEILRQHAEHERHTNERIQTLNVELQNFQANQATREHETTARLFEQQETNLLAVAEISTLEQQLADLRLWEKQLHTTLSQQTAHAETLAHRIKDIQSTWLWRFYTLFRPKRWPSIDLINKIELINFTNASLTHEKLTANNCHQTGTTKDCIDEESSLAPNTTAPQPSREFSDMLPPQHIYELFIFDEREFINVAYRTLLGREPDPNGMNYYLGRLRMGYGKASIIVQLANSSEAIPQCKIKGLSKLIKEEHQASHWFWGLFTHRQRTERLMQKNVEEIGHLMGGITLLKSAIQALPPAIDGHSQRIQVSLKQLALQTTDDVPNNVDINHSNNMTTEHTEEPEELRQLTLRARDIYWRLKQSVQQTQGGHNAYRA